jgi:hypothetical protein
MDFEKEVCALEYAKELKELGIRQGSYFTWCYHKSYKNYKIQLNRIRGKHEFDCSAFTTSELMGMLPNQITTKANEPFNNFRIKITKCLIFSEKEKAFISVCSCNYECDTFSMDDKNNFNLPINLFPHNLWDENLANALAKTIIYIIKNKYNTL